MNSRLITLGCSFTKDNYQEIWSDILASEFNLELLNLAERGSGAEFVFNRLLVTELDPTRDIVVIMWPSADRFDLWADATTPHLVSDCRYASWPDGSNPSFVDHYGNYNTKHGFNLNGSVPRGYKNNFYKYFYSAHQCVHQWYAYIISTQLFLEKFKIPFLMTSAFPLINPIHLHYDTFEIIPEIFNKINLEYFVANAVDQGFFKYCQDNQLLFLNSHHPSTEAHRNYVDNVLKFKLDLLIKQNESLKLQA